MLSFALKIICLTLFDMGFFWIVSHEGGGRGNGMRVPIITLNFVVIAQIIIRFATGIKFDVFHKKLLTSLLLRNYDVITYILADV